MTLAKVAAVAGVSVSTASKAFSGSREISDETRELVYAAAKKCGCHAFIHNVAAERRSCFRTENVGQVVQVHVDFLGDGGAAQFRIGKMRTDMNILVY